MTSKVPPKPGYLFKWPWRVGAMKSPHPKHRDSSSHPPRPFKAERAKAAAAAASFRLTRRPLGARPACNRPGEDDGAVRMLSNRSLRSLRLPGEGEAEAAGVRLRAVRSRSPEVREEPPPAPPTSWEEAEEGAVYTVSARGAGGEVNEAAGPGAAAAAAASSSSQSRALKAGSLPRLVRHLLDAPALGDAGYRPAFLATYRGFARPAVVLGLLLERLQAVTGSNARNPPKTEDLQRALASLLCSWLDGYPQDFLGLEPHLREQLVSWLHWACGSSPGLEKSLPDAPSSRGPPAVEHGQEDSPGQDGDPDPHYILGLQAEEVAAHLTAQDGDLFLRLVPHECLGSAWSQRDKKGHEEDCPTVRATVTQFNLVANAVMFSCLWDTGLRAAQRARLLEKWICVAEECLLHRNFSSLYAVVSALQSTSLHRLKRTWEETS
ncbi:ral guanine nucleotide dissociation stimulator-like 2, partial [Pseudonaja textilis]|uniref:ral guanine nucleotide dissociation stimulator-like 2 n=1 Tax=Pseudonaja textilis TaxID=8673 RepID=UPI000EAA266A